MNNDFRPSSTPAPDEEFRSGGTPVAGGPLSGLRIIEFAGLGPAPFCAMMLADHGAEVIRIDRLGSDSNSIGVPVKVDLVNRSRRSLSLNLKSPEGLAVARAFVRTADGLVEGFRPGVMERLGLGPDVLINENPKLVYGRMTGWGQTGPNKSAAGHDINYIALSGALHGIGLADTRPIPPLNLVGDYGGGAMMLAFGMVAAFLHAQKTGSGQVVDAAMINGAAVLTTAFHSLLAGGEWIEKRGSNVLDTGAPFYDTYETADGLYVSVGAIEAPFYRILIEKLGVADDPVLQAQYDRAAWPEQRLRLARIFKTKTRTEWDEVLSGSDACYAPVLSMSEAAHHPHNIAVGAFIDVNGTLQPAPTPNYSHSRTRVPTPLNLGDDITRDLLTEIGLDQAKIDDLIRDNVVA
tara:strand:- start:2115 stop:3335 length:1221 start_codon:yes stop_codon:yes gene_type:complete